MVCTGGEPLLQLDDEAVQDLHDAGFVVAVETNGTLEPPAGLDRICVSPKARAELVVREGHELKLVYPQPGIEPREFEHLAFEHFFLQPMDGPDLERNTELAVRYCLKHPQWRLSVQLHKLIGLREPGVRGPTAGRVLIVAVKPCSKTRWSEGEQEGSCEMPKSQNRKSKARKARDYIPVTVPFAATPAGETPSIDAWAHRAVWTDRMLATLLENNVRGGQWHTLIDKVFSELNLFCSADQVLSKKGAAGVDRQTVADFAEHEREELQRLHEQLRDGTYRPAAVRRTWIPKPGSSEQRPLGIPTVRDRVVQTALVHTLEPILDATFHARSFGFRHGRGCHDALRCVEELLAAGYVYVVDADLKGYFDSIPKDRLLGRLSGRRSRIAASWA